MISIQVLTLIAIAAGLWIWAFIDIMRVRFKSNSARTAMVVLVLLWPILGALFYLAFKNSLIAKGARKFDPDFSKAKDGER